MNQTDRVLKYIDDYGSITPLEAMEDLGIYRLGARVYDLRQAGVDIDCEIVTALNRYGEKIRFAKYKRGKRS